MSTQISLSNTIRTIPLVNSWYATPLLISPLAFSLVTEKSHLPILNSFIRAPQEHIAASQIPSLKGGPFLDYKGEVARIADFRDKTLSLCAPQLTLASDIINALELATKRTDGLSLFEFYAQVAPSIRDKIEITYDTEARPSVRFFENLAFKSEYYNINLQSCILQRTSKHPRPFSLSTPFIDKETDTVKLNIPFKDKLWDELHYGIPADTNIGDLLGAYLSDPELELPILKQMLTESKHSTQSFSDGKFRVRYFGHACVLIEGKDSNILIDPLVSYDGESEIDRFTISDLPNFIHYAIITHGHLDHLVIETLLRLRPKIGTVIVGRSSGCGIEDISLRHLLNNIGFEKVVELEEYETVAVPGGEIISAPFYGEHGDLDIRAKLTYAVRLDGHTCVFFADSRPPLNDSYVHLQKLVPQVDFLFLGMESIGAPASWLYGPFFRMPLNRKADQSRRLNGSDHRAALSIWNLFRPRNFFVYAMGAEPWVSHITSIEYSPNLPQFIEARKLQSTIEAQGHVAEILFGKKEICCERLSAN